ncbi:hypothetical protein SYNPS1DRAFT_26928 [Syncephalis pseudoplumigaleata]|uniref:Uncharacterized protein n=1 Tax=Syncephalis pseudoplumigaleata TaxID=1712513 RepID=A0A4P9Z5Q1_9FUNG|nr:hypothetical protein SYNPS1DRAFT_26928 [Syncephalis pseudoplumigaleata]|eukprot:RKP27412.1 hypothetical protein SYNPS1DRAFT_26928 [Syncephalis pseudoplumigaleata]
MRSLGHILQRLETESLTPPMTIAQLAHSKQHVAGETTSGHRSTDTPMMRHRTSSKSLYGQIIEGDPDLADPRWQHLFREYFVEHSDPDSDDLLFFVRDSSTCFDEHDDPLAHRASMAAASSSSSSRPSSVLAHRQTLENNVDPVFVKRRQPPPNPMPHLHDNTILWKETFFLNLIVQVPVKLTVAVCKRNVEQSTSPGRRSSMIQTTRRVSRSVYAMPTKSSVNEKERSWECSWPLIYYVVEDFEEAFEQLVVRDGEYLCVELSAMVPATGHPQQHQPQPPVSPRSDTTNGVATALSNLNGRRVSQDGQHSHYKVTLFQGAASFAALMDNYKRKTAPKLHRRFRLTTGHDPPLTEFIMMRGPGGKGHAQVAITGHETQDTIAAATASSPHYPEPTRNYDSPLLDDAYAKRPTSPLPPLSRPSSAASFFQSLKRIALNERPEPVAYQSLKCCMTFVNVPWTSVVT